MTLGSKFAEAPFAMLHANERTAGILSISSTIMETKSGRGAAICSTQAPNPRKPGGPGTERATASSSSVGRFGHLMYAFRLVEYAKKRELGRLNGRERCADVTRARNIGRVFSPFRSGTHPEKLILKPPKQVLTYLFLQNVLRNSDKFYKIHGSSL